MIVKSATGDVDLGQPENVVRGMMFRSGSGTLRTVDWHRGSGIYSAIAGTDFAPTDGWTFVGCDPAIVQRADCERFGIVPQADAGKRGFARTRDGFAVDLYLAGRIGAVWERFGVRRVDPSAVVDPGAHRFIGLHAAHASAEDMDRLCCGAHRSANGARCTLAIGDHAEHEDIAAGVKWAAETDESERRVPGKAGALVFAEGPTSGGTVAFTAGGETKTVRYKAGETDDDLRARIREEYASASVRRNLADEPEPGTPEWIRAKVAEAGYGCDVERSKYGPCTAAVYVYGASAEAADSLRVRLESDMPGDAVLFQWSRACPGCGCRGECSWRTHTMIDPDAVTCKTCQCRWCGPKKETGPTWTATATGHETTLRGYKVTVGRSGDAWRYDVRDWAGAVMGQRPTEREAKEHALRVVPKEPSSSPMFGPCATSPDFKMSTAWAAESGVVSAADLNAIDGWAVVGTYAPITITLHSAALKPGESVTIRKPGGDPVNLTPQAAALRSAMATIDALPWPAADKRALRDAAHAVAEMVEATDSKAPATLRGPVTEMLAALATAAHVGPTVVKDAELARGAAALMMPKRRTK